MRLMIWLVVGIGLWTGGVWLLKRPHTWRTLITAVEPIWYGLHAARNITKLQEAGRRQRAKNAKDVRRARWFVAFQDFTRLIHFRLQFSVAQAHREIKLWAV